MGHSDGKLSHLRKELAEQIPFTLIFTAAGMLLAGALTYVATVSGQNQELLPEASRTLFHALHPIHVLLSAIATTAMFCRYDERIWRGVIVGFVGSIGVCGLSDVFMPYLSGRLLRVEHMHFHWCLIEHWQMVIPFAVLGILAGIIASEKVTKSTLFSHSGHVCISSLASLFYLISYGLTDWMGEKHLPYVFVIVVVCVTVPCCLSDIVFPLFIAEHRDGDERHGK